MKFYEVLEKLMNEPGMHKYRRTRWEKEYIHNDTAHICSIAITPIDIKVILVNKSNHSGYAFSPSAADITANDWYEV